MKKQIIPVLFVFILVVLGCNLPATATATQTAVPTSTIAVPVISSPTTAIIQPATATATATQAEVEHQVNTTAFTCRGISLAMPNDLASGVTCEVAPASEAGAMEVNPEYDLLHIDGYFLQDKFHAAEMSVYSIPEYQALSSDAATTIAELSQLINNPNNNPQSIPFLPFFYAAQLIRTQVEYISFQNGAGVRFLTQYGQDVYPINNYSMFYTFQGITSDGQHYISVILPVTHPDLSATGDDANVGDWAAFSENYGIYIADMTLQIDGYSDDSFVPSLTLLDDLVKSIKVE